MTSVTALEPAIRGILTDPTTDLGSVSAKGVRKQLLARPALRLTEDFIRENKSAIDKLIASVFESVSAEAGGIAAVPSPPPSSQPLDQDSFPSRESSSKRKREMSGDSNDYEAGSGDEVDRQTPPVKKAKTKSKSRALTDEEYAKQLSAELNQNPSRRGGQHSRPSRGPSRTPKRTKKSRDTIADDSDVSDAGDNSDRPARKSKKKSSGGGGGGGGGKGGFQKELILSQELSDVVNTERCSRPQVVKRLWEYIRANDLQNPSNKRQILCDAKLHAVFKQNSVDMFTMNKLLKSHLTDPE